PLAVACSSFRAVTVAISAGAPEAFSASQSRVTLRVGPPLESLSELIKWRDRGPLLMLPALLARSAAGEPPRSSAAAPRPDPGRAAPRHGGPAWEISPRKDPGTIPAPGCRSRSWGGAEDRPAA